MARRGELSTESIDDWGIRLSLMDVMSHIGHFERQHSRHTSDMLLVRFSSDERWATYPKRIWKL
jgi:hypothetical protein